MSEANEASSTSSNEKLKEALNLLNQAAGEKKDEVTNLVNEKYQHLRDAFVETESKVAQSLNAANQGQW